ncbi:unnamed protein product [Clonostachys byssicola]|uniref:Uncharacterized protein n=1 Tax=Clonostachys byssicola TaxID=160290 RepID=A0A9N9UD60_9HYPO|nr:unnamed protein product [Clonostachys byssicola]
MTKTGGANILEAEFLFLTIMDALSADAVYEDTFEKNQLDLMKIRFMRCCRLLGLSRLEAPYVQVPLSDADSVKASQRVSELKTALDQSGTFVPANNREAHVDSDPDSLRGWLVNFQRSYRWKFNVEHTYPVLKWVPKDDDHIQTMRSSFNDCIIVLEKLVGHDIISLARQDAIEFVKAPSQASLMEAVKTTDLMLFSFLQEEQMKPQQKKEVDSHEGQHDPEQRQELLKREAGKLRSKLAGIRSEQSKRNHAYSLAQTELRINLGTNNRDYNHFVAGLKRDQAATDRNYRQGQARLQRQQITSDGALTEQEERLRTELARRDQEHVLQMTALQTAFEQQEADLQSKLAQQKSELQKEPGQRKPYLRMLDADRLYTEKIMELRAQYLQETQGLREQQVMMTQEYFREMLELQNQHAEREDAQLKRQFILRQQEHSRRLAAWQKKHALRQYELEQVAVKRDLDRSQWHTAKQLELEKLESQLQRIREQMTPETRREMENRASGSQDPNSIPIYISIADMKAKKAAKAAAAAEASRAGAAGAPNTSSTTSSLTNPQSPPNAPRGPRGHVAPVGPRGPSTPTPHPQADNIAAADDSTTLVGNDQSRLVIRNLVIDDSKIISKPNA